MVNNIFRRLLAVSIFVFTVGLEFAFSQNQAIVDRASTTNWPSMSKNACISATGKYVAYKVSESGTSVGIVQMVKNNGIKYIIQGPFDPIKARFIMDEHFVFQQRDSLFSLKLPKFKLTFLASNVRSILSGKDLKFQVQSSNGNIRIVTMDLETNKRSISQEVKDNQTLLKSDKMGVNSIWVKSKAGKLDFIFDDEKLQKEKQIKISSLNDNSPNGITCLTLLQLNQASKHSLPQNKSKVTIWSYKSWQVQPFDNILAVDVPLKYIGLIFNSQKKIKILDDRFRHAKRINENFWLIGERERPMSKFAFGPQPSTNVKFFSLISNKNGSEIPLDRLDSISNKTSIHVTRGGRFFIYFDTEHGDFHSYNTKTGTTVNLTSQNEFFKMYEDDEFIKLSFPFMKYKELKIFKVLKNDQLIVKDVFDDLWKIDPTGNEAPICLTSHYAKNNRIKFSILDIGLDEDVDRNKIIVSGYNYSSKCRSIFEIDLTASSLPRKIIVKDCADIEKVVKATNADVWLFRKSTADKFPNWFVSDGVVVKQVSFVYPEKAYNWITVELLNWKNTNGDELQGILYKPQNLDTNRKYPVIVNYYGEKSQNLFKYISPKLMHSADIEIPWMVSRGYIVFVPDMKYRVGDSGKSALECLETGVDELLTRKYVDEGRLGLSGHSYGGWETAYFVTHSKRYKAALIGAPTINFVERVNDWLPNNNSFSKGGPSNWIEMGQQNLFKSMWDRPEWYIQNSPIFYVDKVTTPILLLHNRLDNHVPFSQGAEFFIALQRLGKPAWLLQYDKEDHLVDRNIENQWDLTTRVVQFFDHYLKGASVPLWMVESLGNTGLELDTLGRTPDRSPLISAAEQKRIEEYSKIPLSQKLKRIKD